MTPGSPLVYAFDVEFDCDPKLFQGSKSYTVQGFRSFCTTTIFFKDFVEYSSTSTFEREKQKQKFRRPQMKNIVEYINDHGGWKIIGWCRKGKRSVEGESEKLENTEVNLNLSYLYPSNPDLHSDDEFLKLQIKTDEDGQTNTKQVNNLRNKQD